jgi:hypothetical protein
MKEVGWPNQRKAFAFLQKMIIQILFQKCAKGYNISKLVIYLWNQRVVFEHVDVIL